MIATSALRRSGAAINRRSVVVAALLMFGACGGSTSTSEPTPPPAVQHHDLKADGLSRAYRLFVPLSVDRSRATPLVIVLAGVGNTARAWSRRRVSTA